MLKDHHRILIRQSLCKNFIARKEGKVITVAPAVWARWSRFPCCGHWPNEAEKAYRSTKLAVVDASEAKTLRVNFDN